MTDDVQQPARARSTLPKPDHLGREYAEQFQDASVVAAYHHRPPYPIAVFAILDGLIVDEPRAVLDVGTGTGEIAREMVRLVERVDAVDLSRNMIEKGRRLSGGDDPRLTWIEGAAEEAPLRPPYALITAAASLHWMDWEVVLPRLGGALTPGGVLALIGDRAAPNPWAGELQKAISRYTTNRRYRPYDIVEELEIRGLFEVVGRQTTEAIPFRQSVADYVESFHARNGFSRDRMIAEAAAAFDAVAAEIVGAHARDGYVTLEVFATVTWGRPTARGWG